MKDRSGQVYPILGLVQTPDNGFYAISQTGTMLSINPNGTPRGSRFLSTDILNKTEVKSIIRTHDGGSAVSGFILPCELEYKFGIEQCRSPTDVEFEAFVEKLDQNGNTTWSRSYADRGFSTVDQMIELNDDKGYASIMEHNSNNSLVMLDKNGTIVNSSLINFDGYSYSLQPGTKGFSILIYRIMNGTYPVHYYDNDGIKTDIKMINFTYNPSLTTSDSGYFSVCTVGKTIIFTEKKNSNGELVWERQISSFVTEPRNIHIFSVIETSDGGYLIVLGIDKVR
jgi:hypothetical protein